MNALTSGVYLLEPGKLEVLAGLDARQLTTYAAAGAARSTAAALDVVDGVARVTIRGVMLKPAGLIEQVLAALFGGVSTPDVEAKVHQAAADPAVSAILLAIDSPGGQADGVAELATAIRAANARKPVVAAIEHAGSGAYWAASAAGQLIATSPMSEAGSIGAYAVFVDSSEAARAAGQTVHVLSSAPPLKGAGVSGTEITPAQLAEWQRRVTDKADVFVADVARNRSVTLEKARTWATGQMWIASRARELGLLDEVSSLEGARGRASAGAARRPPRTQVAAAALPEATAADYALLRGIDAGWGPEVNAAKIGAALGVSAGELLARRGRVRLDPERMSWRKEVKVEQKTAWSTACELAQAMVREGKAKSFTAALEETWRRNPDLVAQHYAEREAPASA